jgi:hypothetical protein
MHGSVNITPASSLFVRLPVPFEEKMLWKKGKYSMIRAQIFTESYTQFSVEAL